MVSLSAMRGRFEPEAKKSCRPLEVSATAVRVLGLIQHIHAYSNPADTAARNEFNLPDP